MKYFFNILIGIDQFANTILGGDPDETISSRLGRLKRKGKGRINPALHPIAWLVDKGLDVIDKDHSIDAIEKNEHKNEVLDWNKPVSRPKRKEEGGP